MKDNYIKELKMQIRDYYPSTQEYIELYLPFL